MTNTNIPNVNESTNAVTSQYCMIFIPFIAKKLFILSYEICNEKKNSNK